MISGRSLSEAFGALSRFAVTVSALGAALPAAAFYPFGGFVTDTNEMVFVRWPFYLMDVDRNGDISGDFDGIPITFESGETGYTSEERDILVDAFNVWENLPGSYAAFSFTEPVSDPLPTGGVDYDGINYVALATEGDPLTPGLPDGVLGVTFILYSIDPLTIIAPGTTQLVTFAAGEIIEADIILPEAAFRTAADPDKDNSDLFATAVHEIGHFIGLGHTPVGNLREVEEGEDFDEFVLIEDPVLIERAPNGDLELVGATPTMFPFSFATTTGPGTFQDGGGSLAPDDVSAAYFLYPRQEQLDDVFSIAQYARNTPRAGVPSAPLVGALITAWADHDNNESTGRVPLISTMTGLYTNGPDEVDGRFTMYGLPKRLLDQGGALFDATYIFTMQPMNGLDLAGSIPPDFDSMHNENPPQDARELADYDVTFPSEVFRESGNVFDISNRALGTPFYFHATRRVVVSFESGKSLDQILPTSTPMFGRSNVTGVCPVAKTAALGESPAIFGPLGGLGIDPTITGGAMLTALRTVRDEYLMTTAAGTAFTDGYYRLAPAMAAYLEANPWALALCRVLWMIAMIGYSFFVPICAALALGGLAVAAFRRRRMRALATAAALALAITVAAPSADARSARYVKTAELVKTSDEVVHGVVTETECYYWPDSKLIVTDVTVEVASAAKGGFAKADSFTITIAGGEMDGMRLLATGLPTFKEGEEVVLFLRHQKSNGTVVTAGDRGKYLVETNAETGEKYVRGVTMEGNLGLGEVSKETAPEQKDENGVTLDAFLTYIQETAASQAEAAGDE